MNKLLCGQSFARLENRYVLTHWQDGIELLRATKGSMRCHINGETHELPESAVCVINRDQLHRIYSDNPETEFQCLIIQPSIFTAEARVYTRYVEPVLQDLEFSHSIALKEQTFAQEIARLMDSIEEIEQRQPEAYELLIIGILHIIFQKIYAQYRTAPKKDCGRLDRDTLLYRKMANFIYENYQRKLSLQEIAEAAHVSRNKCCSLFQKYAMQTPSQFVNQFRLEKSLLCLKTSDASIAEVAQACGFEQQSYFNRLFLKKYNLTPSAYRKQDS
ncbi:MAG: AraC family transcriptional regulator [Eubacteriales bacterium]|nr:AraC family transcriptional regulator [Eubacteriales bacterium]